MNVLCLLVYLLSQTICFANDDIASPIAPLDMSSEEPQSFDELPSPTTSSDQYEKQREQLREKRNVPNWSINLTVAPFAFRSTELRIPSILQGLGTTPNNPKLIGLLISGERILFSSAGLGSIGLEAGAYGTNHYDSFSGLAPVFWAAGPYLQYQALYFSRQWFVPTARAEVEVIRYSYHFSNTLIQNWRGIFRIDLGLMLFLNFLEPSAAADMSNDYGVKRIYLVSYYSIALDSVKQDFDLTDYSFRFGLRFEF